MAAFFRSLFFAVAFELNSLCLYMSVCFFLLSISRLRFVIQQNKTHFTTSSINRVTTMFTSVIILCLIYTLTSVPVALPVPSNRSNEMMIIKLFAFNWNAWLRVIYKISLNMLFNRLDERNKAKHTVATATQTDIHIDIPFLLITTIPMNVFFFHHWLCSVWMHLFIITFYSTDLSVCVCVFFCMLFNEYEY